MIRYRLSKYQLPVRAALSNGWSCPLPGSGRAAFVFQGIRWVTDNISVDFHRGVASLVISWVGIRAIGMASRVIVIAGGFINVVSGFFCHITQFWCFLFYCDRDIACCFVLWLLGYGI